MYKLHRFSNPASRLNVDNPGQLLHPGTKEEYGRLLLSEGVSPVGEDVPLPDTDLVLPVLTVRPVSHHTTPNRIYLGVKSTTGTHTEIARH